MTTWEWKRESDLVDSEGHTVIRLSATSPYPEDDMRLIAAAPEMLALLKEIKDQAPRSIVEKIFALEERIRREAVTA